MANEFNANQDEMPDESDVTVDDGIMAITMSSFEQGLNYGFKVGRGKSPRPEDVAVLQKISDTVYHQMKVAVSKASKG